MQRNGEAIGHDTNYVWNEMHYTRITLDYDRWISSEIQWYTDIWVWLIPSSRSYVESLVSRSNFFHISALEYHKFVPALCLLFSFPNIKNKFIFFTFWNLILRKWFRHVSWTTPMLELLQLLWNNFYTQTFRAQKAAYELL